MNKSNDVARLIDIFDKPQSGEWGEECKDNNGTPVLKTTNFTNEGMIDYNVVEIRKITKSIENKYLLKGDILIEKSGGSSDRPVGRVVYFDKENNKYLNNNFSARLHLNQKYKLNSIYVFYFMFINFWIGGTKLFEGKTTGIHNLKLLEYLENTKMIIPEINKQEEFVNFVKDLDKSKVALKESIESLNKIYTNIINTNLG